MLIDRLVREVINVVWGVLAWVVFWGFGGWNRGLFWAFPGFLRKCVLCVFWGLFFVCSIIRALFFCFFENFGHFRTARSGVYMVIGETDSVIRFGFL